MFFYWRIFFAVFIIFFGYFGSQGSGGYNLGTLHKRVIVWWFDSKGYSAVIKIGMEVLHVSSLSYRV